VTEEEVPAQMIIDIDQPSFRPIIFDALPKIVGVFIQVDKSHFDKRQARYLILTR